MKKTGTLISILVGFLICTIVSYLIGIALGSQQIIDRTSQVILFLAGVGIAIVLISAVYYLIKEARK